jgi:Tfp pilus assembly protein PilN
MRPVNLLPERLRPRRPDGRLQGSSYVVVGVLGGLLLAVLLYVVTLNQINSRKSETARAESEAQQADARAATLGPFGRFAEIKATREKSVQDLADSRIDWERMMRELALVLPPDTWITEFDGSKDGQGSDTGSGAQTSGSAPTGASASMTGSGAPSMKLTGCAINQADVAVLLVRLRRMHGVDDVELADSTRDEQSGGGAQVSGGDSAGQSSSCGGDYKFDLTVTFVANGPEAPNEDGAKQVPAALGGGS